MRETGAQADAYAIASDGYVRRDSQRLDAILIESATRGDEAARRLAQPYDRQRLGPARRIGAPLDLGQRPSELRPWDPFIFDWGPVTADVLDQERMHAIHAVNHDLESTDNVIRTFRFVQARIRHHATHLRAGADQSVCFDDRGQTVAAERSRPLRISPSWPSASARDSGWAAGTTKVWPIGPVFGTEGHARSRAPGGTMKSKTELLSELEKMLHDVFAARAAGTSHPKMARAHGYVDGYMRVLLDTGLASKEELLALVAEKRSAIFGPATMGVDPAAATQPMRALAS